MLRLADERRLRSDGSDGLIGWLDSAATTARGASSSRPCSRRPTTPAVHAGVLREPLERAGASSSCSSGSGSHICATAPRGRAERCGPASARRNGADAGGARQRVLLRRAIDALFVRPATALGTVLRRVRRPARDRRRRARSRLAGRHPRARRAPLPERARARVRAGARVGRACFAALLRRDRSRR